MGVSTRVPIFVSRGTLTSSFSINISINICADTNVNLEFYAMPDTPTSIRLEDLDITQMVCGWGVPLAKMTVLEKPLTLRGTVYAHGVGTHADSEFVVQLNGAASRFSAVVGVDDEVPEPGASTFEVYADGELVATSGQLTSDDAPCTIDADLSGAQTMRLLVRDDANETHQAHADWCDAVIELVDGADASSVKTETIILPPPPADITRVPAKAPSINWPRTVGGTPGRPFLFRVPASGEGTLSFAAEGLPDGLELDSEEGIIAGSLPADGTWDVTVRASNEHGSDEAVLTLVGGRDTLCLTPPMGWNSWNVWGLAVDQDKVKAAADAFVETGLAAHGFQYVNIDDGWEADRDTSGVILPNEKFPDMKALGDYIHSRGLKFGIYSSPGPKTCGGYTGSYQHEEQDARTYDQWGVDFLKYDWCSYNKIVKDRSLPELQKPYRLMAEKLAACNRDVVLSLCQYGMGRVWEWGAEVGGQLWRTTGDITDTWGSMRSIGFRQHPHYVHAGPGHWNDPDMLVLGQVGWGPRLHTTHLEPHEQLTHMSLWCLLSAPLLIGCDLTALDEWTLTLLTNDEVIALDQDPLGRQAQRISREMYAEVYRKELHDGSIAVGLFNRGPTSTDVSVSWNDLGISGKHTVRDLWRHEDLGTYGGSFSAQIPPHGVVLVKVS